MARDGCNCYFSFWANFCPFTPLTVWKMKISKKLKKKASVDIIILHKCTKNHDPMLYCSWDMACDTCNFYFSFWAIFCPFTPHPPKSRKNQISKKMKKHLEILSLYTSVPKIMIEWCTVSEMVHNRGMDRDGQTEKVTYRGARPPKNICLINIQLST